MIEQLAKPWGELALYYDYASKIKEGLVPYADFFPEYPPLALWLFKTANIFGQQWFTLMWYGMVALAILATICMIKKLKGNPYIFLAVILPLGGLFWDRFDIFPALMSLLAVYLAMRGNLWSFFALAAGVMLKIYPILLLPILIGMFIKRGKHRELLIGLVIFAVSTFQLLSLNNLWEFHGHRGIQIESIRAIPKLFNKNSITEYKHNSFEIK